MKQAVCGILEIGNRIVSVKRKDHNSFGLIGGKVDEGETPIEAIKRETLEETGFDVGIDFNTEVFKKEDNGFLVTCFKLRLWTEHTQIKEGEEPFLYLLTPQQLITHSLFSDYNKEAFKHYKIL